MDSVCPECNIMQREIATLRRERDDAREWIRNCDDDRESLRAERDEARAQIVAAEHEAAEAFDQRDKLRGQVAALREKMVERLTHGSGHNYADLHLDEQYKRALDDTAAAAQEYEARIRADERAKYAPEIAALRDENADLSRRLRDAQNALEGLKQFDNSAEWEAAVRADERAKVRQLQIERLAQMEAEIRRLDARPPRERVRELAVAHAKAEADFAWSYWNEHPRKIEQSKAERDAALKTLLDECCGKDGPEDVRCDRCGAKVKGQYEWPTICMGCAAEASDG